jgi:hypothetical protein
VRSRTNIVDGVARILFTHASVLLSVIAVDSAALASDAPSCSAEAPACPAGRTCAYVMSDIHCGVHTTWDRYTCLSASELEQMVRLTADSSQSSIPALIERPSTYLDKLAEKRGADQHLDGRVTGACLYDEQCGYRGYCDCRALPNGGGQGDSGQCRYSPKEYEKRMARWRAALQRSVFPQREYVRYQLDLLTARDARAKSKKPR